VSEKNRFAKYRKKFQAKHAHPSWAAERSPVYNQAFWLQRYLLLLVSSNEGAWEYSVRSEYKQTWS
jgi:hypothetical protein